MLNRECMITTISIQCHVEGLSLKTSNRLLLARRRKSSSATRKSIGDIGS